MENPESRSADTDAGTEGSAHSDLTDLKHEDIKSTGIRCRLPTGSTLLRIAAACMVVAAVVACFFWLRPARTTAYARLYCSRIETGPSVNMVNLPGATQTIGFTHCRTFVQFHQLGVYGSPALTIEFKDSVIPVSTRSDIADIAGKAVFMGSDTGDMLFAEIRYPRKLQIQTQQAVAVSTSAGTFFGPDWEPFRVQHPALTTLVKFTTGGPTTSARTPKVLTDVGLMGDSVLELIIQSGRNKNGRNIPGGVCYDGARRHPFRVGDTIRLRGTVTARISSKEALDMHLLIAEQDSVELGRIGGDSAADFTSAVADSGRIAVNSYLRPTPTEFRLPTQVDMKGRRSLGLYVFHNTLTAEIDGSMSSIRYFSRSAGSRDAPSEAKGSSVELLPSTIEMWRDRAVAMAAVILLVISVLRFLLDLASTKGKQA